MRTIDDVRAVLFGLEDDAPAVADVLAQLELENDHPTQRRGWWLPATAVVGAAAAAVLAVVLHGHASPSPTPPAAGTAFDLGFSFSVDAVPGFAFTRGLLAEGVQERGIATTSGRPIGTIQAGGSDLVSGSSALRARRTITVAGHLAVYGQQALELPGAAALSGAPAPGQWMTTVPVVAWSDRPGHWLVVRAAPQLYGSVPAAVVRAWGADVRPRLIALAAAIHTATPTPLRLPFRLDGVPASVTALNAGSDTDARRPSGSAVFAEFGMEVTVEVNRASAARPGDPPGHPVRIGAYSGRVDTRCSLQPAPTPGHSPAHADCELSYRAQQWRVEIFVDGPGGGSRPITAAQFVDLARHLRLAPDPSDAGTWFDAAAALPR